MVSLIYVKNKTGTGTWCHLTLLKTTVTGKWCQKQKSTVTLDTFLTVLDNIH